MTHRTEILARILTTSAAVLSAIALSVTVSACGKSVKALADSGKKEMDAGRYDKAATEFAKAISKNPDRAEYYISYGFALLGSGDMDGALAQFDKAHSDKDNSIVNRNNKYAYRGRGITLLRQGRYEEACSSFASAAAINVKTDVDTDIDKYLALSYIKQGNYKDAIKLYSSMLDPQKPDAAVLAARAEAYGAGGEKDKAVADYEAAIKADPNELTYYFEEYEYLINIGDEDAAGTVLEHAAGIKAEGTEGRYKEGILYYLQGDYENATTCMGEAQKAGIPEADYYFGRISQKRGDLDGAKVYYSRYSDSVGGNVTLAGWFDGMAECAVAEGDYDGALRYVKQGLALTDVSFTKKLLYEEVCLYETQNEYEKAMESAEKYLKLYPDDEAMNKEYTFLYTRTYKAKKK